MRDQLIFAIDRTVESLKNKVQILQEQGRKEFQTQTTRVKNAYDRVITTARERIHAEQKGLLITTADVLTTYVANCIKDGEYVLDIETTGLDPFNDLIVGICLYSPSQKPAYIPCLHTDLDNQLLQGQLSEDEVKSAIQLLMSSNANWINHNTKFDAKFLIYRWDVKINNIFWDTHIGAFLLNENEQSHALKYLHAKYVSKSKDKQSYQDLFEKAPFNYIPLDIAEVYGANDGIKTYEVYQFQKQYLTAEHPRRDFVKLYEVFTQIEMPLIPVLIDIELAGVEIREDFCTELSLKYRNIAEEQEEAIYSIINRYSTFIHGNVDLMALIEKQKKNSKLRGTKYEDRVNLNSSPQLKILFFDILKFPKLYRRDPMSCGKEQQQLWLDSDKLSKQQREFLEAFIEWRKTMKLVTSFIEKIPKAKEERTQAVHTNFNATGTTTGRFSSSHPIHKINLQQIPSRNKDVRKIFKARDGHVFIGSDFSQIEPRILASISGDEKMIDAYETGKDLYALMASEIFNVPYEECLEFHPITGVKQPEGKDRRTQTKSVLLGIMYDRGVKAIAEQFGKTTDWGQKLVDNFFASFPEIKMARLKAIYQAEKLGYVDTICGRKRRLPEMKLDKEDYRYVSTSRKCLNARIQGSSADIMKLAMVRIHQDPQIQAWNAKILLTVHDEVIVEVRDEYALQCGNLMAEIMKTTAYDLLKISQKCDVEIARVWSGDDVTEELEKLG